MKTLQQILMNSCYPQYAWVWLFWLLSQTWITLHIWTPKCERLASTEKLYVTPMYNSLLIDQSLALNRRRDDEGDVKTEDLNLNADDHENEVLYMCAVCLTFSSTLTVINMD